MIGTAAWSRAVHLPAASASSRVRFVGALGRDRDRTLSAVGTMGEAFFDLDSFLDAVDIVGLAVPPDAQVSLATAAIEAGKHVLLEKPVSLNVDDATRLAELARARSTHSIVFFTHRLLPDHAAWSARARAVGSWTLGVIESYSSLLVDSRQGFHSSAWRHEHGALWDVGPHAVAQLCGTLGLVESVFARRGNGDFVSLVLEHATGAVGTISVAADIADAPHTGALRLLGASGATCAPVIDDWIASAQIAYGTAVNQLCDQIDKGSAPHECDLVFGAHVTRVLAAAERSILSGRIETP
ncbi:MAG: Gfo/Idh/MocA family oxidoreductase [Chryseoglobus sp.]|nr:Gfo/Idh/MocA family oxidoreductase [Microcella sp.]